MRGRVIAFAPAVGRTPTVMSPLLLSLMVLALLACLALVHAVGQAEAGHEDETGFHPASPRRRALSRARVQPRQTGKGRWSTAFQSTETPVGMFGPL